MEIHIKLPATDLAPRKWLLRVGEYFFFLVGVVALGIYLFVWVDAKIYQERLTAALQESRQAPSVVAGVPELSAVPASPTASPEPEQTPVNPERAAVVVGFPNAPLGQIEIGSVGIKAMIAEGIDPRTLRRAVGHIPGTSLPGESGNVGIAGHRDTFFRGLRNIQRNDEITLTTSHGSFHYVVDFVELVGPNDTEVLDESDQPLLTLVTCYPFYYVGPAPKRFVVRAHLASM
jgi:sortase A